MKFQAIPIIRIFDEGKAKEFYLGFLGMRLDWEHRIEPDSSIYMQVSRGDLVFHLPEGLGFDHSRRRYRIDRRDRGA